MAEHTLNPTQSRNMMDDDAITEQNNEGEVEYAESDPDTCEELVESTGEVCGRELPCPYHD